MSLPLFLIGARGCGKTTIGLALSKVRKCKFSDTDHFVQQTARQSIADIVNIEGWQGFRRRESRALIDVSATAEVIATGGGIVLAEENCHFMRERGCVVYLHAASGVLVDRLMASPEEEQRPTLTGRPIIEEMEEILMQRETLYRQTAHFIIDAVRERDYIVRQLLTHLSLTCVAG